MLTATGCLYFMDPSNVASTSGLQAIGALLMILDISFVVLELILIAVVGAIQTKHYVRKAFSTLRSRSFKVKEGLSRAVSSVRGGAGACIRSKTAHTKHPGAPSLSSMKARPSGTLSDDSSAVSMGRGDSMRLFLTAPDSHLHRFPTRSVSQLDRFPSRSTIDSEVELTPA